VKHIILALALLVPAGNAIADKLPASREPVTLDDGRVAVPVVVVLTRAQFAALEAHAATQQPPVAGGLLLQVRVQQDAASFAGSLIQATFAERLAAEDAAPAEEPKPITDAVVTVSEQVKAAVKP
jgi:hypothetical protein